MIEDSPDSQLIAAAESAGYQITQSEELPKREPGYCPVPHGLNAQIRELLEAQYPTGLYAHQANAIESALAGEDVCLSTSTASGKSLVFMSVAADLALRNPPAKTLTLYPARALIQDQIEKWEAVAKPLGVRVGFIDGGVSTELRPGILRSSQIVLMTPDVAHAWLLSHLDERAVADFMRSMRLLVLDEAHVYEGAFGTNMAYFLRRLEAAAQRYQVITSTATIGNPAVFISALMGRSARCFGSEEDRSASPAKTVLLARDNTGKPFDSMVNLLVGLTKSLKGHFLAFADSRRMVEQLVATAHRQGQDDDDDLREETEDTAVRTAEFRAPALPQLLPFRAGYETEDRNEIQKALSRGQMVGVVSTSAMELGIDIGDIDVVVLLGLPPTAKAFWQRCGRAGRRRCGACLIIDDRRVLVAEDALRTYLNRPLEPSWLYLENRYIQYAHALCAAAEIGGGAHGNSTAFESLPASFRSFLENELHPTEIVPADLYPLKQKAQSGPHLEFPIRTGIEQNFQVRTPQGIGLGNLTFSQALREAYPGAIYLYVARAYRVYRFDYKNGEISARREKRWTTRPLSQTMVFPKFQGGTFSLLSSDQGFLAEAELQVSERVTGFIEQRGPQKEEHRYGPGSPYYQRDITRFFATTGVCWYFRDKSVCSEAIASRLLEAFCSRFGIQERDLGVGLFFTKQAPFETTTCQGACIFDATNGSLRLTQRLAERYSEVLALAMETADMQKESEAVGVLRAFSGLAADLRLAVSPAAAALIAASVGGEEWVVVIAPGQQAVYLSDDGPRTVVVKGHRYTPQGLMYQLEPTMPVDRWMVAANALEPIYGQTKMLRANLMTGETEDLPEDRGRAAEA
jgi:DEAD/DEAH box helicase domain-containing protein